MRIIIYTGLCQENCRKSSNQILFYILFHFADNIHTRKDTKILTHIHPCKNTVWHSRERGLLKGEGHGDVPYINTDAHTHARSLWLRRYQVNALNQHLTNHQESYESITRNGCKLSPDVDGLATSRPHEGEPYTICLSIVRTCHARDEYLNILFHYRSFYSRKIALC